ncbi:YbbR family protein [Thermoanaerobacterium thermosaccharolyticum]|uniref:YbbR family protein n=2 Tax=Thermoanaerobacterium thermosaccharolyticum TaxID=1517 RepID=A0A223I018_THETR|nr:YbbR family protein [Thermoanaerobacterium thermosaccharolyticum]
MGEKNPEISYDVGNIPVNIVNVNTLDKKGLTLIGDKNFTVTVRIKGRRSDVMNVRPSDIQVEADVSRIITKGINVVPVQVSSLPKNVTFVSANPSEIKLDVDKVARVQMPVRVKVNGTVIDGYAMKPAISTPGEVIVSGPESKVNLVKNVIAQVDMSNKSKDVNISVPVEAVDSDNNEVKGVDLNPKYIKVEIDVNRAIRVHVTAKIFGKPMDGYDVAEVSVLPEYVYVTGEDSALNSIKSIDTKQIDISGKNAPVTENVSFDLPDGISLVKSDSTAKVYIDIEKIVTSDITLSNVDVKGADSKNVTVSNSNVVITVTGPETIVNSATPSEFSAYVDVTNASPGTQTLPINVTTDLNLKIVKVKPEIVDVNIQ